MKFSVKKPQDIVGIDIGSYSIKLVHSSTAGLLLGYAIMPLQDGNTGLIKRDKAGLVDALKQTLAQLRLGGNRVYICLNSTYLSIKRISLVSMPEEELKQAVGLAARDLVAFDTKKAIIDFKVIGHRSETGGVNKTDLLVIIAEKATIDYYIDIVKIAGLKPAGITVSALATEEFFKYHESPIQRKATVATIDIGHLHSELSIYSSGKAQFVRSLPVSGLEFTNAMTGVLVSDQGRLALSFEEAEAIKRDVGIPTQEAGAINKKISNSQILALIRPLLEKLANEVKRSCEYSRAQFQTGNIEVIYLIGAGALLKNLDASLSQQLNLKVRFLDIPTKINYAKPTLKDFDKDYILLIPALASTIDRCASVNLLPEELREERVHIIQKMSLKYLTIFSFIFLLVSYLFISIQTTHLQRQIKNETTRLEFLKEITQAKEKLDARKLVLKSIRDLRPDVLKLLLYLSNVIEEPIVLNGLSCDQKGEVNLKGEISTHKAEILVADLINKLFQTCGFKDVKLVSIQKKEKGLYTYEITCNAAGVQR